MDKELKLISINRELIDIMERLKPLRSDEKAQTVYELLNVATDIINEDYMATIKRSKIKRLRKAKGLTQQELADKCGVSQSYMNKVERGKTIPTRLFLYNLGKIFEIDYKTLLQ